MKFLDSVTIARIRSLRGREIKARGDGTFPGLHRTMSRGFSQEFAQHKSYQEGSDVKFIDWKVYARKDRFFIKEFLEEKNLRIYLINDCSASMGFLGPQSGATK